MMQLMFDDREPLDWRFDPLEALRRWPLDRQVLMLHSGRLDRYWARWTILTSPVGTYRFGARRVDQGIDQQAGQRVTEGRLRGRWVGTSQWVSAVRRCPVEALTHQPFADLRRLIHATDGLWVGYLGYDLGRWVESLPDPRQECDPGSAAVCADWPIIELGYCPGYLAYDGTKQRWWACGTWRGGTASGYAYPDLTQQRPLPPSDGTAAPRAITYRQDRSAYEASVHRAKQHIADGDVFQVNLAHQVRAEIEPMHTGSVRRLYDRLARASGAWYGAYLELESRQPNPDGTSKGEMARAIASASPELFLQVDGQSVVTRPIKGTRPSHVSATELRESEKDQAELNMIVDVLRNDLGKVCSYGSLRVREARSVESHPSVHHGVATIEGRLHPSKDVVDLLRASFPGGSITGAPKVRAMQIIDSLEPVRRGPYCGCIGYLSRHRACLNVAIRTMLINSATGQVDFSMGSGIVADSDPASEYDETLDKAAVMLKALRGYSVTAHVDTRASAVAGGRCHGKREAPHSPAVR